jgi:tetratricopeptide (TPR) repeat protein
MPKTRLYLLVGVSVGLLVLFLLLPKQPASVRNKQESAAAINPDSLKLQQAIEMVNGPNPMAGITILRELVAADSTNLEAQYWLGVFAVKSGQYDKAINRFETVLRIDPTYLAATIDLGGVYLEMDSVNTALQYFERGIAIDSTNNYALLFTAQTQEKAGKLAEAKRNYEQLLRHNTDTIVTKRVQEFIENIDKKLNP